MNTSAGDQESQADKIEWVIETNGWIAVPVPLSEDPPRPPYTYTIGLEEQWGHPELVIFGLQPVAARGLLGLVVEQLSLGGDVPEGVFTGLLDNNLACAILPVSSSEIRELCPAIAEHYGRDDVMMSQFVWPDRSGMFPWQPGYDERLRLAQPVLSEWIGTVIG